MSLFNIIPLNHLDTDNLTDLGAAFGQLDGTDVTSVSVIPLPSGLPEGFPPGRAVCVGPGTGGVATFFLAYADPPVGSEYRRRCIGISMQTAPEEGGQILVRVLGRVFIDHDRSVRSRSSYSGGGVGDTVPGDYPTYGNAAYLKDGDQNDALTQGLLTEDTAESTGDVKVGAFLPGPFLLLKPTIPGDL